MAEVVDLGEHKRRETRALFRGLADLVEQLDVPGAIVVLDMPDGPEKIVCAGTLRRRGAAAQIGFLLQLEDMKCA